MSASGEAPAPKRRGLAAERGAWLRIREPLPAWMPWALGVVPIAVLLVAWFAVTAGRIPEERLISPTILPSPVEVVRSFPSLWFDRALTRNLAISFTRVLAGFAAALAVALFGAVACTNTYLYFREWDHQRGLLGGGGMILDFVKVLKAQAVDQVVLMPAMYRGLDNYLDAGDASREWPQRVSRRMRNPARLVRTMSCQQPPPFTWMTQDTPEHLKSFFSNNLPTDMILK